MSFQKRNKSRNFKTKYMITRKIDYEAISLTVFNHPEHGLSRIIGDYDENPCVKGSTEPTYKCQQVEEPKNYFMLPKTSVKELIKTRKENGTN